MSKTLSGEIGRAITMAAKALNFSKRSGDDWKTYIAELREWHRNLPAVKDVMAKAML